MKLVRLYSNRTEIFPEIEFRPGLNVILARVKAPEDETKSDHSLGKTLLARLLDFMLLKEVDGSFFTRKKADRFEGFVFYLEILLPDGKSHATIRRGAEADTKISLKLHAPFESSSPLLECGDSDWDHANIPIKQAKETLNSWLAFDVVDGWTYRKGISYFLRTQNDYRDVFRVDKFARSADIFWKPYMADLLGLPGHLLSEKYEADRLAAGSEQAAKVLQGNSGYTEGDGDRLAAEISLAESAVRRRTEQLQDFSFHEMEMEVSDDLVKKVDTGLSETERKIYYLKRDIQAAAQGMAKPLEFNLTDILATYEECALALPELLVKSYEELVEFNRKLASERNKYLRQRIRSLENALEQETKNHSELSTQRQRYLEIFKNRESLERFKKLQMELIRFEENLNGLRQQLARVREMSDLQETANEAKRESERLAGLIRKGVQAPTSRYKSIRDRFQNITAEFLHVPAVLFVKQNTEGNLEFHVDVKKAGGLDEFSSEADGATFKKLLCMAFDLAILTEYADSRFYHFIYHDGALEGEDDRKKFALLKLVDRICEEFGIQYIMSAIQHELPRLSDDSSFQFQPEQIRRELHDDGAEGRLFRMSIF